LTALTQYSFTYPGFTGSDSDEKFAQPWKELKDIFLNEKRSGGLKYNFIQFHKAIHEVRDHWSTDTWRVLRRIEEELQRDIDLSQHGHLEMLHTLDNLITAIVAFIGLNRESISREQGWTMLDLGRKIEQSLLLITQLKATMVNHHNEEIEFNLQQAVLMSNESLVNYRYKYRMPIQNRLVLDLLIFDPNNPRSLIYQVDRLKPYLRNLPKTQSRLQPEYERLILEAETLLKLTDKLELATLNEDEEKYKRLEDFLSRMYILLSSIPDVISKSYFKHVLTSQTIISY
jgi:uncharacterized alpha-E superfamily protein